jgi:hypothetical protein
MCWFFLSLSFLGHFLCLPILFLVFRNCYLKDVASNTRPWGQEITIQNCHLGFHVDFSFIEQNKSPSPGVYQKQGTTCFHQFFGLWPIASKVIFLKPSILHFCAFTESRPVEDVVVHKYTPAIDHAGRRFWYCLLTFLGKLYFKLQKIITYSYNIQIIHILMRWNPLQNGEKTHNFFVI